MSHPPLSADASRRDGRSREDLARIAISVIVATILAAQVLIGFSYRGGQTFPVVAYPMFMQAHYDGERLNDYLVYLSADGGEEKAVGPEAMDVSGGLYYLLITAPIVQGKPSPLAAVVARQACESSKVRSIAISVYDSGYTIRRDGPVQDERRLMGTTTYDCSAF